MTEPIQDLAHIGHAELLTPCAEESMRFFVELFGMEVEGREGSSVYLRGWGDYQRYSLKLTESELPGLGHMAIRAWSPAALARRVAAIEQSGLGIGWIDGDHGHGPAYRFNDPVYEPVVWTAAERARGQAWGVKTVETFHTYGTPDVSGTATGPPIPPTSQIPDPGGAHR